MVKTEFQMPGHSFSHKSYRSQSRVDKGDVLDTVFSNAKFCTKRTFMLQLSKLLSIFPTLVSSNFHTNQE